MDDTALAAWLTQAAGAPVTITARSRLSGGAIQQNWRLDVTVGTTPQSWVLRTDAPATLAASRSRAEEFALLQAAFAAGVPVPEPLYLCAEPSITGRPFFIMRRLEGIAAAHRIVRSETLAGGRPALTAALAQALARIHAITPPRPDLAFLGPPDPDPCTRFIRTHRAALDSTTEPRPILEWGLRHLERSAHPPGKIVLCHNDFRTGNYMATPTHLTGILDWEFAAWGDPHEDIGWLCARCWRFGGPGDVGGVGNRATFAAAYPHPIDWIRVHWWERAATIRWAVIALAQAARHASGQETSLELALTAHIVPELELDIMRQTAGEG